jgi:hypothetical protein
MVCCYFGMFFCIIRIAVILSVEWYHCHPATATFGDMRARGTHCHTATVNFFNTRHIDQPHCQYCHCHTPSSIKMTALISRVDWYHCHPATATLGTTTINSDLMFYFFVFFPWPCFNRLPLPILPLPRSNRYHSNRLAPLYPTVPLPPSHCHSPCHTHPEHAARSAPGRHVAGTVPRHLKAPDFLAVYCLFFYY